MTRVHHERRKDEVTPQRHAFPRLLLTKETYKPLTLIRLYTGTTADIPIGWHLADGTAGTPDMRDKFVVGAGNLYAESSSGGSTTISASNLPAHTHPYDDFDTTYTASTASIQPGSGTAVGVVTGIAGSTNDTPRTTGDNSPTGVPYLPPYYAVAYIINTETVTIVTDAKLR
jgi:hypothetical protein